MIRRRIGIFAGTFNPVHSGHRAFALAAADTCHLNEVIFLPEPKPRMKTDVTNVDFRAEQLKELLNGYPNLSVRVLNDKSFNVAKTLPKLSQLFPDADMTFLVGSDVAFQLKDWNDIGQLLKTCDLAIGLRSRHTNSKVRRAMKNLQADIGSPVRYELIKAAHADVASSQFK